MGYKFVILAFQNIVKWVYLCIKDICKINHGFVFFPLICICSLEVFTKFVIIWFWIFSYWRYLEKFVFVNRERFNLLTNIICLVMLLSKMLKLDCCHLHLHQSQDSLQATHHQPLPHLLPPQQHNHQLHSCQMFSKITPFLFLKKI